MPSPATQTANPALANLQDIAMPNAINLWPIAPGWWAVFIITLCIIFWGLNWGYKRFQQRQSQVRFQKSLDENISNISALKDDAMFEQAALIYIQQLRQNLSGSSRSKTGDSLVKELEQWLTPEQAHFLAIERYQAPSTPFNRARYISMLQTLSNQLEKSAYVGR